MKIASCSNFLENRLTRLFSSTIRTDIVMAVKMFGKIVHRASFLTGHCVFEATSGGR